MLDRSPQAGDLGTMSPQRQRNEAFADSDMALSEAAIEDFGDHTTAEAGGKAAMRTNSRETHAGFRRERNALNGEALIESKGRGRLAGVGIKFRGKKIPQQVRRMDVHDIHADRDDANDAKFIQDRQFRCHVMRPPQ